jgi:2-phospho-L-lactate guanylyltransferase
VNNSAKVHALLPIKAFSKAKSRLKTVLTAGQCAELARHMATDVIAALRDTAAIDGITIVADGREALDFATAAGCDVIPDDPVLGLSGNLGIAAGQLQDAHIETVFIVPGDLPLLRPADLEQMFAQHSGGLSLCEARRDGGTNALVISPPAAITFAFGERSAERHLTAARAAGLAATTINIAAFDQDIDTPEDVHWLCSQQSSGQTISYLASSGIRSRLIDKQNWAVA